MKPKKINQIAVGLMLTAAVTFSFVSCNNKGPDSKSAADSANDAKANSSDSATHANASMNDSIANANKKGFKDDAHFVADAADGGAYEVAAGYVALKNSSDKRVKEFAHMMIKDHTRWGNELKAYAKSKNITVPDSLSNDKKDKVKNLSEKANDKFDVKYMDEMKSDHKDDLDAFKDAEKNTKDAGLKSWLDKTIPGINHHLMDAERLDSIIDKEK